MMAGENMKVSGVILAGGKSSRMGVDKSILPISKNKTMISNIVEIFTDIFEEVIVVSNQLNKYEIDNIREASDIYLGAGPLGGIHAGLVTSSNDYIFVVACDMPFIETNLIEYLIEVGKGYDITVPIIANKIEPLFAVYSKNCKSYIEGLLKSNVYKVKELFSLVKVNYVDEQTLNKIVDIENVFYNVNTPEDYNNIKKRYRKEWKTYKSDLR